MTILTPPARKARRPFPTLAPPYIVVLSRPFKLKAELEKEALGRASIARRRTESTEIPARELYDIYMRLSQQANQERIPVDLDGIWETLAHSAYLRDLGCRVSPELENRLIRLEGIPDISDGTLLTASREVFERGIPGERPVHFASYGDPIFDALMDHLSMFDLPRCARRLAVDVAEVKAEVVGYAVAETDSDGGSHQRLVTALRELTSVTLDETAQWNEADAKLLQLELAQKAEREFRTIGAVKAIERLNEEAASSQVGIALLVARSLIQDRLKSGQAHHLFWKEIAGLEESLGDAEQTRARIPVDDARKLPRTLYDVVIPAAGQEAYLDSPRPLCVQPSMQPTAWRIV